MAQSIVMSGLLEKRSELLGTLDHHAQEAERLDEQIRHLDITIKMFDPQVDLRTLPPRRFFQSSRIFAQGECNRLILEILREAGGTLNTQAIAERIALRKGLDKSKMVTARETILESLKRGEKTGKVRRNGREGMALLWQLL